MALFNFFKPNSSQQNLIIQLIWAHLILETDDWIIDKIINVLFVLFWKMNATQMWPLWLVV